MDKLKPLILKTENFGFLGSESGPFFFYRNLPIFLEFFIIKYI